MKTHRRRNRARWMRADVVAPWISLVVILGLGWLGAQTLRWFGVSIPPLGGRVTTPAPIAAVLPSDAPADEPSLSAVPAPTAISAPPPAVLVDDIAALRQRKLEIPVKGLAREALVSTFRERRGSGWEHEAMDILAPRGTEVLAVEDGRVAKLFTSDRGGITVYQFDPAERFVYYYAHLDRYGPGLADGAEVRRGDVIGYVGTTGNAPANTPHLHFAIFKLGANKRWWDGVPIDPFVIWDEP